MDKAEVWSVVVGCVIKKGNTVLLLKRGEDEDSYPGLWELPSGKVEFGETLDQAIKREVTEETGLRLDTFTLCGYFQYEIEKPDRIKYAVQMNFVADTKESNVVLTEHVDFKFVSLSELPNYKVSANVKQLITQVLS